MYVRNVMRAPGDAVYAVPSGKRKNKSLGNGHDAGKMIWQKKRNVPWHVLTYCEMGM
jgi:hypothetical protein